MKKKIMAALLAGVMLLQQPVSGWCAQNTELTQKSEARQESESSEDTADGSEDDKEATGTAAADDRENSQEEDSEDVRHCRQRRMKSHSIPVPRTMRPRDSGRFWIIFTRKVWICPV